MSDTDIVACIPAAFSSENNRGEHHVSGHYSTGGKRRGSTAKRCSTVRLDDNTHFQQYSLVRNHRPASFKNEKTPKEKLCSLRYRRALCEKNGKYSVIQSRYPTTMNRFARQLTSYDNAWYLDMGSYAYGWYRRNGAIEHLSLSTIFNRHKQTNWLVIRNK